MTKLKPRIIHSVNDYNESFQQPGRQDRGALPSSTPGGESLAGYGSAMEPAVLEIDPKHLVLGDFRTEEDGWACRDILRENDGPTATDERLTKFGSAGPPVYRPTLDENRGERMSGNGASVNGIRAVQRSFSGSDG